MTPTPEKPPLTSLSTNIANSKQITEVIARRNFDAQVTVSLHTPFARRKFKNYFYRWSVKFLEVDRDSREAAQKAMAIFLRQLEELEVEVSRQGYGEWCTYVSDLEHQDFVVKVFDFNGKTLLTIYKKLDGFLSPVYWAWVQERVSKNEFERIKSQVNKAFSTLRQVIEDLPIHTKKIN